MYKTQHTGTCKCTCTKLLNFHVMYKTWHTRTCKWTCTNVTLPEGLLVEGFVYHPAGLGSSTWDLSLKLA